MKRIVETKSAPSAIGPYSQAVAHAGLVFVSGQIPIDPATGELLTHGGIAEQTHRVLSNIEAILEAAGSGLDHVLKTTVYLRDMNEFSLMNEVYASYFPADPPARATVQVSRLPKDVAVEIDAIAKMPG